MKIERKQKSVGFEIKEKQGHKQSKPNKPTNQQYGHHLFWSTIIALSLALEKC
jgi:hypothetical protein